MRIKLSLAAALLALAMTSGAMAQQTQGQDDQSDGTQARQTASASWSHSGTQPDQAGDLYQARTRGNDDFGGPVPQANILPGALNPGKESLDNGRQPEPRD